MKPQIKRHGRKKKNKKKKKQKRKKNGSDKHRRAKSMHLQALVLRVGYISVLYGIREGYNDSPCMAHGV